MVPLDSNVGRKFAILVLKGGILYRSHRFYIRKDKKVNGRIKTKY